MIVAHEDERGLGLLARRKQQLEKLLSPVGVERAGGLIGDDHLRAAHQRARGGHALLLAHTQLRDRRIEILRDVELRGDVAHRIVERASAQSFASGRLESHRQQDVFPHREIRNEVEHLEHIAQMPRPKRIARPARHGREVLAQDAYASAGRLQHTGQQAEQGGLATATRPVQKHRLAAGDRQRIDRQDVAPLLVRKAQRGQLDRRRLDETGAGGSCPCRPRTHFDE